MDKVSALQQCVDQMALDMFNALRLLPPMGSSDDPEVFQENILRVKGLARDLLSSAQKTNDMIDLLPGLEKTEADQLEEMQQLQAESDEQARNLREAEEEALQWSQRAQESLRVICETRLKQNQTTRNP
jgi:hypothetical protein